MLSLCFEYHKEVKFLREIYRHFFAVFVSSRTTKVESYSFPIQGGCIPYVYPITLTWMSEKIHIPTLQLQQVQSVELFEGKNYSFLQVQCRTAK